MKKAAQLILLLLLTVACEKEDLNIQALNGKWQWVRTDGGFAHHIHDTPASTGKNIVFEFTSNGTFREYINGYLTSEGAYKLENRQCIHDHTNKPVIFFPSGKEMMIEKTEDGFLYLSDEYFDGLDSQYKKIEDGNE